MIQTASVPPRLLQSFVATLLFVGCGAALAKMPNHVGAQAQSATTKTGENTSEIVRSKGLADAANDPNIVKAIKEVLACPWNAEEGRFNSECPGVVAFDELSFGGTIDQDKGVLTLLNLLDDMDEKVRYLALDKMPGTAFTFKDKSQASRILAQTERETTELCASRFGTLVGQIDLKATGLLQPVKQLVETHPNIGLRKNILGNILHRNSEDHDALNLILAGLKSDNEDIRYVSVSQLLHAQPSFASEVCPAYVTMLDDPLPSVVGLSALHLGYGHCTGQIDTLLKFAKKRAAAGGEKEWYVARALYELCENKATSGAQKKEAAKIAKAFATGKNDSLVRKNALEGVTSCDPAGAEVFLKRLSKDSDRWVKEGAQELLGKLKKK